MFSFVWDEQSVSKLYKAFVFDLAAKLVESRCNVDYNGETNVTTYHLVNQLDGNIIKLSYKHGLNQLSDVKFTMQDKNGNVIISVTGDWILSNS